MDESTKGLVLMMAKMTTTTTMMVMMMIEKQCDGYRKETR